MSKSEILPRDSKFIPGTAIAKPMNSLDRTCFRINMHTSKMPLISWICIRDKTLRWRGAPYVSRTEILVKVKVGRTQNITDLQDPIKSNRAAAPRSAAAVCWLALQALWVCISALYSHIWARRCLPWLLHSKDVFSFLTPTFLTSPGERTDGSARSARTRAETTLPRMPEARNFWVRSCDQPAAPWRKQRR